MKPTLVIVLDDVGPANLAQDFCVPSRLTPELADGVLKQAVRHQLWTMPSCSATRAALWTRRYPSSNGIGTIVRHNDDLGLDPGLAALPDVGPGRRVYYGKHHLCPQQMINLHPDEMGWSLFHGHASNLAAGDQGGYYDWLETREGETHMQTQYAPTVMTAAALETIATSRATLVVVGMALIHKPYHYPPSSSFNVDHPEAMMRRLDQDAAQLVEMALSFDWRVVMFSDNGATSDLGGGKGSLYQEGICTDLYVWNHDAESSALDVVDVGTLLDGQLSDDWDAQPIGRRRFHFAEKFSPNHKGRPDGPPPGAHSYAIARDEWKLISWGENHKPIGAQAVELFNLEEDPREQVNQAVHNKQVARDLIELAHDEVLL